METVVPIPCGFASARVQCQQLPDVVRIIQK
jgi:hypothetical protein